jgi:hypothetical protein
LDCASEENCDIDASGVVSYLPDDVKRGVVPADIDGREVLCTQYEPDDFASHLAVRPVMRWHCDHPQVTAAWPADLACAATGGSLVLCRQAASPRRRS